MNAMRPFSSTPMAPWGQISRFVRDRLWIKGPAYMVLDIGLKPPC